MWPNLIGSEGVSMMGDSDVKPESAKDLMDR